MRLARGCRLEVLRAPREASLEHLRRHHAFRRRRTLLERAGYQPARQERREQAPIAEG